MNLAPQTNDPSAPSALPGEHGEACPGCPLRALPYVEQLARKRARVSEAFAPYPALAATAIGEVRGAEPHQRYRTRVKWAVGPHGVLGLYVPGTAHVVADATKCPVVSPVLAEVAAAFEALLGEFRARGAAWGAVGEGAGALRAVDLREAREREGGGSQVLVTLGFVEGQAPTDADVTAFAQALAARVSSVAGVAVNLNEAGAPQLLGPATHRVWGVTGLRDRVGEAVMQATYGSFVQAHRGQAAFVQSEIVKLLGRGREGQRVLDVYGGSGAFGLALAAHGARVELIESLSSAVDAARAAAAEQGLALEARAGDAEAALVALAASGARYDLIVVNPPRRGLTPGVRAALAALRPAKLAYVSCAPDTLARDLDHLARLGLRTDRPLRPLDMIPLTGEVEVLTVLVPGELLAPRILFEGDTGLIVDKPPHIPTTPQGEYAYSLLDAVRKLPSATRAVPVHRLDIGTSGACLFARSPEQAGALAKALTAETSQKTYFALVKGVTPPYGAITKPLRDGTRTLAARTRYKRLQVAGGHSLLRVQPDYGRTHQIRRHMATIGHPLVGDARYGDAATNRYFAERYGLDRTFLHCTRIAFEGPPRVRAEAELPGDLLIVALRLGLTLRGPKAG